MIENLKKWASAGIAGEDRERASLIIRLTAENGHTAITLTGLGLTSLPDAIGNLSQLTILSLAENYLTEVPDVICNLPQIEEPWLGRILRFKKK